MTDKKNLAEFIDRLLAKNCPFALWSMPGSNTPEILISEKKEMVYSSRFEKLNGGEGFVFAPYKINKNSPLVLLKPGILKKRTDKILEIDIDTIPGKEIPYIAHDKVYAVSKEQYLEDIEKTIDTIKSTTLAKVIISRLIPFNRKKESVGEVFMQLFQQTPNALVYLVNLPPDSRNPKAALWMGATPEVLLKSEGKNLETVSLAGTQSRRIDNNYSWHTKDIDRKSVV